MAWILYPLLCYLALSYGLLVYLTVKLLLGRPMHYLVGPQCLSITPPPVEPARATSRVGTRAAAERKAA